MDTELGVASINVATQSKKVLQSDDAESWGWLRLWSGFALRPKLADPDKENSISYPFLDTVAADAALKQRWISSGRHPTRQDNAWV